MNTKVMPGMRGKQREQTLLKKNPHLKCLFMSGYTADIIADHGGVEQDIHFINKPFKKNELASRLRKVLDGPEETEQ